MTENMAPNADHILQTCFAFWGSKVLFSAVEMGVFTELAKGAEELETLQGRLGIHPRAGCDFFDTLVALGFLRRSEGKYSNTAATDFYLDRNKASYIGGILEMANQRLYGHWSHLTAALRTGKQQNEGKDGQGDPFEALYADPARLKTFLAAMTGISRGASGQVALCWPAATSWQNIRMAIAARASELAEIGPLREKYRREMDCQIIHDSIHGRAGWTREFALVDDGAVIGYGSVAVAGPWRDNPAVYEFFVEPGQRDRIFDAFSQFLQVCEAKTIETQSNDPLLSVLLHVFAQNIRAEAILFEDRFETSSRPEGSGFRATTDSDVAVLQQLDLDQTAGWVATIQGEIAGAGGVLYHYNRPYGDVYMKIAEPFRRLGLGAYLVQELKAVCRRDGSVPAARCNVNNVTSRRTLQKAGFVPCGALIVGDLAS